MRKCSRIQAEGQQSPLIFSNKKPPDVWLRASRNGASEEVAWGCASLLRSDLAVGPPPHASVLRQTIWTSSHLFIIPIKSPQSFDWGLQKMERAKRFELSTSTLARWCSTNWATLASLEEVAENSKFAPAVNVFLKKMVEVARNRKIPNFAC